MGGASVSWAARWARRQRKGRADAPLNSARLKVGSLPASSVPLMNLPPFSPVALQSARTDSRPEEGDDSGGAGGTTHTVLAVHSNTMKTSSRLSSVQSRLTPDASRNVRSRSLGGEEKGRQQVSGCKGRGPEKGGARTRARARRRRSAQSRARASATAGCSRTRRGPSGRGQARVGGRRVSVDDQRARLDAFALALGLPSTCLCPASVECRLRRLPSRSYRGSSDGGRAERAHAAWPAAVPRGSGGNRDGNRERGSEGCDGAGGRSRWAVVGGAQSWCAQRSARVRA